MSSKSGEPQLISAIPDIPNWKKEYANEPDPFNKDILAYKIGKEEGRKEFQEEIQKLFFTNLEICCYYSTKFHDFLAKEKIECKFAVIKAKSFNSFQSLFLIKLADFANDELRKVLYKEANEIKKSLKPKDVYLEIVLMNDLEVDKASLKHDGFFLMYKKDEQTA